MRFLLELGRDTPQDAVHETRGIFATEFLGKIDRFIDGNGDGHFIH